MHIQNKKWNKIKMIYNQQIILHGTVLDFLTGSCVDTFLFTTSLLHEYYEDWVVSCLNSFICYKS